MPLSDEDASSSEESDSVDDGVTQVVPLGTKREFTICEEDRIFLMNFNSTHLVTKWVPHLIVRTTSGVLAAGLMSERFYFDEYGVSWRGETHEATNRLGPAGAGTNREQMGDPYECTNADGAGKVIVYSREPLDCQYWVRELLGIHTPSSSACFRANAAISRCVRQLNVKTLEEMAPYFNTDPLSVLAYLGRCRVFEVNLTGNVSHAFLTSLGNPSESVYVSPISRSELEGVTLLRIDDEDYSLVSGKRVGYEAMGDVFHVYEEGGSLRRIDDDALVG